MGLSGNFRETSFADLLQFYSVSKQTVAVTVRLGAGDRVDGVFYFSEGDLVGATLGGAEGREAVRRALRLRDGAFSVEMGVRPATSPPREALRSVVMEEVVRLDEENRRGGAPPPAPKHSGAVAAGAGWWAAPDAAGAPPAAPTPRTPAVTTGPVPPAAATTGPVTPATRATPPASPAAARPPGPPAPPRPGTPARPVAAAGYETTGPIPPRAAAQAAGAPATRPPAPAEPGRRPPSVPPAPPAWRPGPGVAIAIGVAALALLGGVAWYVLAGNRPAEAEPAREAARSGPRGVQDDAVVLGMVASFTGSNKERGRAMRLGWETAIAEVNDAGGIHGRKLRLVAYDDGYDPARTGAAMKEVVEAQGAFAIVGNVGTATSAVAAPYAGEKDAVFFGALSGADVLRKSPPDRHVFNFRASLSAEAAAAVRYLVDVRRISARRIAVLAQDDDFGRSGQRGALARLEGYGVPEAEVLKLSYPRNTADVRDAVAKLRERAGDVEAVVMVATYKPAATFVRKTRDARLKLFYTTVSADSNGLSEELVLSGEGYTEDVLLTQVVPVPTSGATTLIRYRAELERRAPGEKPGSTSLEAWIGAQIFFEGLRRAGRELDTAKLVAALEGVQGWDLGIGGPITFGPADHQGSDMVFGWLLQPDGGWRQVELE